MGGAWSTGLGVGDLASSVASTLTTGQAPNQFYCHTGNNESVFCPICQNSEAVSRGDLPWGLSPQPPFLEREKSGGESVRLDQETGSQVHATFSALPASLIASHLGTH